MVTGVGSPAPMPGPAPAPGFSDDLRVYGSTPAGQAAPVAPAAPAVPAPAPTYLDFRPELAGPQVAGLFSNDPTIQALLNNPNVDIETLIEAQITLNNKALDVLNASKAKEIEANRKTNEANQAQRYEEIQKSKQKAEAAASKSWWSKVLNIVAKAAQVVAAVATIVAAVAAAPVTGGVSLVAGLAATYLLLQSAVELANEINVAVNGESARWSVSSLGSLVGWALEKMGVDKETAQWIALGLDVVANVAVMFLLPGVGLAAAPRALKAFSMLIGGAAQMGKAGIDIAKAFDVKGMADINSKLDTLQAQIDRLLQNNKQLMEMLKVIQESKTDNFDTVSEALEKKKETNLRILMA